LGIFSLLASCKSLGRLKDVRGYKVQIRNERKGEENVSFFALINKKENRQNRERGESATDTAAFRKNAAKRRGGDTIQKMGR
jgi:hypothetical protein